MKKLNSALALINSPSAFIFAVEINFKSETISENEIIEFIQDEYYDYIGASGHFRLLPDDRDCISLNYIIGCDNYKGSYDKSISRQNGITTAKIVFALQDADIKGGHDMNEEIAYQAQDLNELQESHKIVSNWQQININKRVISVNFNVDHSSATQSILILDDTITPEEFVSNLNNDEYFTTLDYTHDDEKQFVYNNNAQTVGEIVSQNVYSEEKKEFSLL